jgi:hypothetical protein
MSKVKDTFFGGAEKKAGKAQQEAAREAARLTKEQFEDVKVRLDPFISGAIGGVDNTARIQELDQQIQRLQSFSGGGGFLGGLAGQAGSAQLQQLIAERDQLVSESGQGGSFQIQQALSGALGPEAQGLAFEQFQESPGVEFLRNQGLRLIESGAGATGGLGGGDRLRALTEFSQGLALQDLSNQFNRLGAVTGTGLTAAQALGGVSGQAAAGQSQALAKSGFSCVRSRWRRRRWFCLRTSIYIEERKNGQWLRFNSKGNRRGWAFLHHRHAT